MIRNKTAWGDFKSTVGASKSLSRCRQQFPGMYGTGVWGGARFFLFLLWCASHNHVNFPRPRAERKARDQPKAPAVNVNIGGETCQNELRNQSPPSCRHKICCEASVACPGALRRRHASVMRLGALHTIQKQLGRPSHDGNKLARLLQALCTGILV